MIKDSLIRVFSIYIKSILSQELKIILKELRSNTKNSKETDTDNPLGVYIKKADIDEIIKIMMIFSCGFFNKDGFSKFHTEVLRELD